MPLEVTVEKQKKHRTPAQNKLQWAAHLAAAVKVFEFYGNEMTKEEVHEELKEMFLPDEGRRPIFVNGRRIGERRSTTWLSTGGMTTYLGRIEVFCAENGFPVEVKQPEHIPADILLAG